MKFFTLLALALIALLAGVASGNDIKERIQMHRESQKLDREVRRYLTMIYRGCGYIVLFTHRPFCCTVGSYQDAL